MSRVCDFPLPVVKKGCARCITFHSKQYEHAGRVPFYGPQNGCAGCTPFINAGMSDYPASSQSGTRMKSGTGIRGPSLVQECSGTRLRMSMPAALTSTPVPSCVFSIRLFLIFLHYMI